MAMFGDELEFYYMHGYRAYKKGDSRQWLLKEWAVVKLNRWQKEALKRGYKHAEEGREPRP